MSHTPGPWVLEPEETRDGSIYIFSDGGAFNTDSICVVEGGNQATDIANARLIAAAPDLLEALQKVLRIESAVSESARDVMRAAIAKAGA